MRRFLFHSTFAAALPMLASGQVTDTVSIPVFEKAATIAKPNKQHFSQDFDSLASDPSMAAFDLSQLLADESNVYINDYGPGMLSSPSMRGGAAAQSILIWNGAKLNSPMLGTVDLSMVAIDQFQEISVFTSSASNIYSSGGIGGGIWLGNRANFNDTSASLNLNAGSFGTYGQSLKSNMVLKAGRQPLAVAVSVNHRSSENDFRYIDNSEEPFSEQTREHSSFSNFNAQLSLSSFIGKQIEYSVLYWRNQANREIPNTIKLRVPSQAFQKDTADRFQGILKYRPGQRWRINYMAFYEVNKNKYSDERIGLANLNKFKSLQQTADATFEATKWWTFQAVANHQFITATSGNFNGVKQQSQESLLLNALMSLDERRRISVGAKAQHVEGDVFLLPTISFWQEWIRDERLIVKGNYAKTARLPTMNELYWSPGGNPDLQPEIGNSGEIGLESKLKGKKHELAASVSYFLGRFDNWIQWLPQGATFRPQNVQTVEQQGCNANLNLRLKAKRVTWVLNAGGVYTKIVNSGGETLTYVPEIQGHASIAAKINLIEVRYLHTYMGQRFITSDNQVYMPAYNLSRVSFNARFLNREHWNAVASCGVDNLWNENYQVIAWRPMPKRNFFFGLELKWSK